MSALPGSHLCFEHQGNHSHYAPHNCVICKQAEAITVLREAITTSIESSQWPYVPFMIRARIEAALAATEGMG